MQNVKRHKKYVIKGPCKTETRTLKHIILLGNIYIMFLFMYFYFFIFLYIYIFIDLI